MARMERDTGLDVNDEKWIWDDLARELTGRYGIPDLSELVRILEEKKPGILEDIGYVKK